MTSTESPMSTGYIISEKLEKIASASPRLRELLDSGHFDWENPRHREAYLRAWVSTPRGNEIPRYAVQG